VAKPRKATNFGSFGVYSSGNAPNPTRRRFLRPLAHAGDKCKCGTCDRARIDNAAARRSINWPAAVCPVPVEADTAAARGT